MVKGGHGRRMKLGIMAPLEEGSIDDPTGMLDSVTPRFRNIQAMAQMAEFAGLDSFWLPDHLSYRSPRWKAGYWEVFTFLSALAAITSQIRLGPLVACTSFRNPTLLAKMASSLDEISDGRFILGLGCGWHKPEYDAFGYPFDHRVGRFEEVLQIIAPLLRKGHVDFRGQYYSASDADLRPRGPSPSGPEIWIGARKPRMLRLTAQYADAWNTGWLLTPKQVTELWAKLASACVEEGRDPETLGLTAFTSIRIQQPSESTNRDARCITGTPHEIAAVLQGFADVGVNHLVVVIKPPRLQSIERLGHIITLMDH